jgi:hypothetical protein
MNCMARTTMDTTMAIQLSPNLPAFSTMFLLYDSGGWT